MTKLEIGEILQGALAEGLKNLDVNIPESSESHDSNNENSGHGSDKKQTRKLSFEGTLHKCPNCGSLINPTEAICSECGYQVSERQAAGTLQLFSQQLLEIEKSRRKSGVLDSIVGGIFGGTEDDVDEQKITLIQTFPVPNTIEELSEFMFMAASNIDVGLSKKTMFSGGVGSNQKRISDAWVGKMQQIYRKAEMSFPNEEAFVQIKEVYENKMRELKYIR